MLENKAGQVVEKPDGAIMPFPSLLEHLAAVTERVRRLEASLQKGGTRLLLPPFSDTHVFLLGEADKIEESIAAVWENLDAEMKSRVPMPFKDVTLAVRMTRGIMDGPEIPAEFWAATRIIQAPDPTRGGATGGAWRRGAATCGWGARTRRGWARRTSGSGSSPTGRTPTRCCQGNRKKIGKPEWSLNNTPIHIVANGTARAAIEKAEEFLLERADPFEDEYGCPMVERTLKVRVTSCEWVLTLDA